MTFANCIVIVLFSLSMQLTVHAQSLGSGGIVKRSVNTSSIKPKELFLCALKAKNAYAQRSVCQRVFELQQEAHHCASRRLLMMRIDHQLAKLQRLSVLAALHKARQHAHQCSRQASQTSESIDELTMDIALLQEQHINLTRHQSKLVCISPKLMQMRDNLTEIIQERKEARTQIQHSLKNLTETLKRNEENTTSYSETTANKTNGLVGATTLRSNLSECNAKLGDLVMEELQCFSRTLPALQERLILKNKSLEDETAQNRALQNKIKTCNSSLLQCQASNVCDELQTAISKGNKSNVELQQVTDKLEVCTSELEAVKRTIPRCEKRLVSTYQIHDALLVNVTSRRIRQGEMDQAVMQCETQLSSCHENITICGDMSAELEDGVAGCWSDLDKWKFRTDLCEGKVSMLVQNINATEDYIGDMRAKLSTDKANLEVCQDQELYHKSGHVQAVHTLARLKPELNSTRATLATCLARCPHLRKTPDTVSRCPQVEHDHSWHESATGCFFVTRPGAGHARMQAFCGEQAPGAAIARLSSAAMAKDAYAALLDRYMAAARTEPLRRQRRAWVDFEDDFEYAGYPTKSPQCKDVTCACWTMRFAWGGRSQLYECEHANLPAVCFVPLTN